MRASILWFLVLAMLLTCAARASEHSLSSHSAHLDTVKERVIEPLSGGSSKGPRRIEASEQLSQRCGALLSTRYEPVLRDPADPHTTTSAAARRADDLRILALGYVDPLGDYYRSEEALQRVIISIDDLLAMYHTSAAVEGNWHSWLITIPDDLGVMALLLEHELPKDMWQRVVDQIAARLERMVLTGANAAWEARNHVYLALLTRDVERLSRAADKVFSDVRYGVGVNEDYSYLFHGAIPYAGGYGAGFAVTVANFIHLFDGTPWAIDEEAAAILENLLLEHSYWFLPAGRMDMHISGRGYESRGGAGRILEAMLLLGETNLPRAAEMKRAARALIEDGASVGVDAATLADSLMETNVVGMRPHGFRYWPVAEMGVFRTEDFHIGFRQYSKRVQDYEYLTQRGAEGWNLPMGFTNILRTDGSGDWYDGGSLPKNIEMEFLPSATSRVGANPNNVSGEFYTSGYSLNYGTAEFAGGCGWEDGGVAGFVLEPPYGDITAKKSLHFFDRGYWALGTGIRSTIKAGPEAGVVRTNIIQWRTSSPAPLLELSNGGKLRAGEEPTLVKDVKWLWLDRVGVVLQEATDVYVNRKGDVVNLWLDHGLNPANETYAYAVLPVATLAETKAFAKSPVVAPVQVDLAAHAVADKAQERLSIVFFDPGQSGGVMVDHPAIVYRKVGGKGGVVAVQNPLHAKTNMRVELSDEGPVTFSDPEIKSSNVDGRTIVDLDTQLGRIYRLGLGPDGEQVKSYPRADLADPLRFRVSASSNARETLLTIQMPRTWRDGDYSIGIQGLKGHHLVTLSEKDIVEILPDDVVVYRWNRTLDQEALEAGKANSVLLQRNGDFRITYDTELVQATDYFTVPVFKDDGKVDESARFERDRNNPYWTREKGPPSGRESK